MLCYYLIGWRNPIKPLDSKTTKCNLQTRDGKSNFMRRKKDSWRNVCAYRCVCPHKAPTTSVLPWLLILLTEDWIHYSASWSQSWTVVITVCQGQRLRHEYIEYSLFSSHCFTTLNVLSHLFFLYKLQWKAGFMQSQNKMKRVAEKDTVGTKPGKIMCDLLTYVYMYLHYAKL